MFLLDKKSERLPQLWQFWGIFDSAAIPGQHKFITANNYRHITINGCEFILGDIQANIVKQLHKAAFSENPWLYGKTMLNIAGSRSIRLRDIFKSKRKWEELILSDKRGYYCLNVQRS